MSVKTKRSLSVVTDNENNGVKNYQNLNAVMWEKCARTDLSVERLHFEKLDKTFSLRSFSKND